MSGEHANAASGGVIPSDAAFRVMNTRFSSWYRYELALLVSAA